MDGKLSLWCFMHDAEITRFGCDAAMPLVEFELKLGYPRIEPTAYRFVTCKMAATVKLDRLGADEGPAPDIGIFIAGCASEGFEVFDADLAVEPPCALLKIDGYIRRSLYYLQILLVGDEPAWYCENERVELDLLIKMGERQWDLWAAKAGPELLE